MCEKKRPYPFASSVDIEEDDGDLRPMDADEDELPLPSESKKTRPRQFMISSIYIGQGDCTLIECPDEKFVMIDCGCTEGITGKSPAPEVLPGRRQKWVTHKEKISGALKAHLKGRGIEFLIITHSDADHHNQMILLHKAGIEVRNVIIGNLEWYDLYYKINKNTRMADETVREKNYKDIRAFTPKEYWENWNIKYKDRSAEALGILNTNCSCKNFFGLTLNDDNEKYTKKRDLKHFRVDGGGIIPQAIPQHRQEQIALGYFSVCASAATDESNWSIKIIAAEVESVYNDKSVFMNTASLVTMVEIDGQKALFTGDSTGATFDYLLNDAPKGIKDYFTDPGSGDSKIGLLQVPHHGSATNESNHAVFIAKTRPKKIFTSVKFDESGHHLPRWGSLGMWKRDKNKSIIKGINKTLYFGYWITRDELLSKRIGPFTNEDYDFVPDEKQIAQLKEFMDNVSVISHNSKAVSFTLLSLKPIAPTTERQMALMVINVTQEEIVPEKKEEEKAKVKVNVKAKRASKTYKRGDNYFVIQKTKRAIVTNGARAINVYLENVIKPGIKADPTSTIRVIQKDLVDEAFDQPEAINYVLNKLGLT